MPRKPARPTGTEYGRKGNSGGGGLRGLLMDNLGGDISANPDITTPDVTSTTGDQSGPNLPPSVKPGGFKANNWFAKSKANDLNTQLEMQRQSGITDQNQTIAQQQALNELALQHLKAAGMITSDEALSLRQRQLNQDSNPDNINKSNILAKVQAEPGRWKGNYDLLNKIGVTADDDNLSNLKENVDPSTLEHASNRSINSLIQDNIDAMDLNKQLAIKSKMGTNVDDDVTRQKLAEQYDLMQKQQAITPGAFNVRQGSPAYNQSVINNLNSTGNLLNARAGDQSAGTALKQSETIRNNIKNQFMQGILGNGNTGNVQSPNPTGLPQVKPGNTSQDANSIEGTEQIINGKKGIIVNGQFVPYN